MKAIVSAVYAGNIQYFSLLNRAEEVVVDLGEHFEKQSYRNRACIYGANGALNLIIPLKRKGMRTPMKDVTINNEENWQNLHWRSLESAYRSSPYFEYYEHELKEFYTEQFEKLTDFNRVLQEKLMQLLGIEVNIQYTEKYVQEIDGEDYRKSIHPKVAPDQQFPETNYIQVFENKCGFTPNLSVMDLLFNEGPNAISYL